MISLRDQVARDFRLVHGGGSSTHTFGQPAGADRLDLGVLPSDEPGRGRMVAVPVGAKTGAWGGVDDVAR
jgi:hypothetical protein